jgi:C1A family cysteine protease
MSGLLDYIYSFYQSPPPSIEKQQVNRVYGWKKGNCYNLADKYIFDLVRGHSNIVSVDLRSNCPEVYDQGHLGSCTANAIGFCYHYDELKQKESTPFTPSRLFIYYNERNMEGHVDTDSGAEIHDGIHVINTIGVCDENDWVYDIAKFTEKPSQECYSIAEKHRTVDYRAVEQSIEQLKAALIQGFPVVFGFTVYESFESDDVAKTGLMPMPKDGEKILGGHAVAVVGFDDSKKLFTIRNSWGSGWGDKGYFYMPYEFITNPDMASDFWTVTKTKDAPWQSNTSTILSSESQTVDDECENSSDTSKEILENHLKTKIIYDKIMSIKNTARSTSPLILVGKRNRKNKLNQS